MCCTTSCTTNPQQINQVEFGLDVTYDLVSCSITRWQCYLQNGVRNNRPPPSAIPDDSHTHKICRFGVLSFNGFGQEATTNAPVSGSQYSHRICRRTAFTIVTDYMHHAIPNSWDGWPSSGQQTTSVFSPSHPGQLSLLPSAGREMSASQSAVTLCGLG